MSSVAAPPSTYPSLDSRSSESTVTNEKLTANTNPPLGLVPEWLDEKRAPKLSIFRLLMAHIGAALALFLATTDATIVSTSLPTITSDLAASETQYTWVGVSYMLTQTAFQPLYGKISDLVGRTTVLYGSMAIFAAGSLLCGAAQTITWLIIARAVAGIGGGGIVSSVWVITSEIVEVQSRAKWSQALSVTWACSAVAGPLLGGFFSNTKSLSWRWAFYLNVPVCFVALVVLLISLRNVHLGRPKSASWRALGQKFDFIGLLLFMTGTSSIVVGFSFAADYGWTAPLTLTLIILGIVILICGGFYELRTKREALFPRAIFNNLTTGIILVVTFLHNFAFNAGTFYLALYFQAANGSTPLQAGLLMLPYSLGSSLASMPAAWFIGLWQKKTKDMSGQKWVICTGLILAALGFGLLILLHENSPSALQAVFPLIAGAGLGMLFHAPYQVFTKALKPQEIATGTSAFFLVRFTGATIGLSVAGAIFYGRLQSHLPADYQFTGSSSSIDWHSLHDLEPLELRSQVLHVVSSAIQAVWLVCAPCLGVALAISAFLRIHPMDNHTDDSTSSQTKESPRTEFQSAQAATA
ncbi:hypothetical protein PLICRDRAFT_171143 [Plicaturopsis crispa FD-325 SS-3]|nr:hypothetical protein PLICRDRAFT_171143 [Plicaturopsis crispa FD-325 SS-3]